MTNNTMYIIEKYKKDPVYFVTEFLTGVDGNKIIPTQTQMNVLYMDSNIIPITGPRQSGKSTAALLKIFTDICFETDFKIVSISSSIFMRKFTFDTIKRWINDLPEWFGVKVKNSTLNKITFTNGNSIEFISDSMDSVNQLRGLKSIDLMFIDERNHTQFSTEILNKLSTFDPNFVKRVLSTDVGVPFNEFPEQIQTYI